MGLDVNVKISLSKPAGNAGSWFPLIYTLDAQAAKDEYGEYTGLDELVAAGYKEQDEVYKAANKMLMQEESARPKKFAVLKQKTFAVETFSPYMLKNWRQFILADITDDEVLKSIADYIKTTDKMLFLTWLPISGDIFVDDSFNSDRIIICCHDDDLYLAAAIVGATAGYEAGSFTYKNIVLNGVAPFNGSETLLNSIRDKNVIVAVEKAGDVVTSDGVVTSGEYADIIDSKDYIVQNISYKVQKVLNNNKKVAYTNEGIALLEGAVNGVLKSAANNGMIATDESGMPIYSVSFALRSETDAADRAARKYPYGKFSFELAGAIHTADINGEITV